MAKAQSEEVRSIHEEMRGMAWGVLMLRLTLGGFLASHGFIRLLPGFAQHAGEVTLANEFLGPKAAVIVVGFSELFVGMLLFIGLWVRVALVPAMMYFAVLFMQRMKTESFKFPLGGSVAEEFLLLFGVSFSLLVMGPGRLSIQRLFRRSIE